MPIPVPCRVLVVDDHPDSAESLARILEMEGHEATYLTSGESIQRVLDSFHPHILLLDIAMPDTDGWELAREIRSRKQYDHIKLVAVTAFAHREAYESSRRAGFDAHVAKPVDLALLKATLPQCFDSPSVRVR